MSEEMQSATVDKLFAALSKAQGKLLGAKKDTENPFHKSKYADLASVWEACRAALCECGLCVVQTTRQSGEKGVCVVTILGHSSGEWIRGEVYMPAQKPDAQGFGSAITYARRYGLAAIVGVAPEDDDANAASVPKASHEPIKMPPAKAPAPTREQQAAQLPTQLTASVEAMELHGKVKASISNSRTVGELQEVWLDFSDVDTTRWTKAMIDGLVAEKKATYRRLMAQQVASAGAR